MQLVTANRSGSWKCDGIDIEGSDGECDGQLALKL